MDQDNLYQSVSASIVTSAGGVNNLSNSIFLSAVNFPAPPKTYLYPSDPMPKTIPGSQPGITQQLANYAANVQLFGQGGNTSGPPDALINQKAYFRDPAKVAKVADGLSNTITYSERWRLCGAMDGSLGRVTYLGIGVGIFDPTFAWELDAFTTPTQAPQFNARQIDECQATRVQSFHNGVINCGLADGSVRTVGSGISQLTWQRALKRDDAEPLGGDW